MFFTIIEREGGMKKEGREEGKRGIERERKGQMNEQREGERQTGSSL